MKRFHLILILLAGVRLPEALAEPARMAGPLPMEQQEIIRRMAAAHAAITRHVVRTDTGYEATTTSADGEVARMLQSHVDYMKRRMASGARVRRWDPAFEEMFRHHRDIRVTVTEVDGGLKVVVEGTTPEAVAVARHHADIISGFVKEGRAAVQRAHPAVLGPPPYPPAGDGGVNALPTAPSTPPEPSASLPPRSPPLIHAGPPPPPEWPVVKTFRLRTSI